MTRPFPLLLALSLACLAAGWFLASGFGYQEDSD